MQQQQQQGQKPKGRDDDEPSMYFRGDPSSVFRPDKDVSDEGWRGGVCVDVVCVCARLVFGR